MSVRTDDGEILAEEGRGIGVATNNVAEYTAAVEGLKLCKRLGASRVLLRSDSRLLVEQLSGRFRVKNPTLIRLHQEVRRLASEFDQVRYQHVPREQNKDADRMANVGVDEWLAGKGRDWRPPPPNPGLF